MSSAFLAAIFDLDGVITDTGVLHARAWKNVLDPLLSEPFDLNHDYRVYIAGRPRLEGLVEFLNSRAVDLSHQDTKRLCDKKNNIYLEYLQSFDVPVNTAILARIAVYAAAGVKIGVASSSKNAKLVLSKANLVLPGIVVDGNDVEKNGLRPKPSNDIFVYTARLLGVNYDSCIIFEDSLAALEQVSPARGVRVEISC